MRIALNKNFQKLETNYLFSEIARRVTDFKRSNPSSEVISLGIGDVTLPIAPTAAREMALASRGLGTDSGFVGYGDTLGTAELREAISRKYRSRKIHIEPDEIFINDGAKSDLGNIFDVLGKNEVLIGDPVYPVYLDASIMSGQKVRLIRSDEKNGFLPSPRDLPTSPFVIFLCSPNNPSGATFEKKQLKEWVEFAILSGSLIIFDAAYESYITDSALPHSIFEIEGAERCAIEICSLSKSAGFTGIRCGWTAIHKEMPIHSLWKRRQNTKFNGASYISQRGALAALSEQGELENAKNVSQYMKNARKIADFLKSRSICYTGGKNAPYLWFRIPTKEKSWEFFDRLLYSAGVVGTPGIGFGAGGEGFFRFSAFAKEGDVDKALSRLEKIL